MSQENYELAKIETLQSLLMTFAVGLWIYWLWSRRHLYRFALQMPGILGLPVLGIFILRIHHPKSIYKVFGAIFKECKSYTVCIWLGIKPVLLTSDPHIIEKVLCSHDLLKKASFYQPILSMKGGSLIADPPEIWHHNRKVILPSFSHKLLVSFFPIFHKAKLEAVSKLDKMVGKGEHQIREMLRRLGLFVAAETTMGYVFKEGDTYDEDMITNFDIMVENLMIAVLFSFVNLDRWYRRYFVYDRAITKYESFLTKMIQEKLKSRANAKTTTTPTFSQNLRSGADSQDSLLMIKKTPTIFLDIAIDNYERQQLKWNDVYCESGTLILASFETSASVVLGAIVMLAMHPEYQEQLFDEIYNYYPEKNFEMKPEDTKNLPYQSMVINEVLRLMPPVPMFARHVVKDVQLTKDLLLPKGLDIMIDLFHLHRRTDIWGPDAEKFCPDNFLPENLGEKRSHAFMPFSKGPRNCIGYRYGYHSINVMLSGLVRNFRFTTSYKYEKLRYYEDIAIKFIKEPGIEVHRREV